MNSEQWKRAVIFVPCDGFAFDYGPAVLVYLLSSVDLYTG